MNDTCREIVTKERLYERLNNAIKECEVILMKEEVRLATLRQTKWNLDEYFEDLTRKTNIAKNEAESISKINIQAVIDDLYEIQNAIWEVDIPSPTVPEYVEHHEQMQSLMALVGDKIKQWKEAIE